MTESEYLAVLETSNAAVRAFEPVRIAYRTRKIGDAEFIAARNVYLAAQQEFEVAYAARCATVEAEEAAAVNAPVDDESLPLF